MFCMPVCPGARLHCRINLVNLIFANQIANRGGRYQHFHHHQAARLSDEAPAPGKRIPSSTIERLRANLWLLVCWENS